MIINDNNEQVYYSLQNNRKFDLEHLKALKAKKYIEQSISIQGDNAVVLEHLGDILMRTNDWTNASVYYKKAYEYDRENLRLRKKAYPE